MRLLSARVAGLLSCSVAGLPRVVAGSLGLAVSRAPLDALASPAANVHSSQLQWNCRHCVSNRAPSPPRATWSYRQLPLIRLRHLLPPKGAGGEGARSRAMTYSEEGVRNVAKGPATPPNPAIARAAGSLRDHETARARDPKPSNPATQQLRNSATQQPPATP
jgi:hypothetical protein